jgi:NADPH:quinone reductase
MSMRVMQVTHFGGPEVLVASDVPNPVAGPGQVVIAVAAVDVLFLETQIRQGWGGEYFTVDPPYVPGDGAAGEVISVGQGVDPGWVGRRVVAATGDGGYAEQVEASADTLITVPDGLSLCEAAALLHDGRTALALVEGAQIRSGEWVLVLAAGGGLGALLVQLAHTAGAHVIGAARGQRKLDLVRELGADTVIDYTEVVWTEQVRQVTGGTGPDVVFDGAGGQIGRSAFEVTAPGGRFSAHGAASGGFADIDPSDAQRRGITVRGIEQAQLTPPDARRLTESVLADAAAGRIRPIIGQTFPLEQAAAAHTAIEARSVIGKTLLLTEPS